MKDHQAKSDTDDPAPSPSSTTSPTNRLESMAQKVVVSHRGTEIHGYVLAREGNRVHIAWTVASGRRRSRTFHAETVFLSGDDRRWKEKHIPIERLDTIGQGAL